MKSAKAEDDSLTSFRFIKASALSTLATILSFDAFSLVANESAAEATNKTSSGRVTFGITMPSRFGEDNWFWESKKSGVHFSPYKEVRSMSYAEVKDVQSSRGLPLRVLSQLGLSGRTSPLDYQLMPVNRETRSSIRKGNPSVSRNEIQRSSQLTSRTLTSAD
jgi:hypothetical protein